VEEKRKFEDVTKEEEDKERKEKDTSIVNEMTAFEENEDLIRDWLEESV